VPLLYGFTLAPPKYLPNDHAVRAGQRPDAAVRPPSPIEGGRYVPTWGVRAAVTQTGTLASLALLFERSR